MTTDHNSVSHSELWREGLMLVNPARAEQARLEWLEAFRKQGGLHYRRYAYDLRARDLSSAA
jgi:hypothetical protein